MKHTTNIIRILTVMLLFIAAGLYTAHAQGILVHKKNGETIDVPATELKSVSPYYGYSVTTVEENVEHPVDLGLSVMWNSCNLGSPLRLEPGDHYAWGENQFKNDYTSATYTDKAKGAPDDISGIYAYDPARCKLSEGWRMPTKADWQELIDKCQIQVGTLTSGEYGAIVTGPNGKQIFLPFTKPANSQAGLVAADMDEDGTIGCYWMANSEGQWDDNNMSTQYANCVSLKNKSLDFCTWHRANGLFVRPVYGVTAASRRSNQSTITESHKYGLTVYKKDDSQFSLKDTDLDYIETYEATKQEGEGYTGQFSEEITKDIPTETLKEMNEHGMPIYSGSNPPIIEGVYDFASNILVWSSDNCYKPGQEFCSILYSFSNQDKTKGLVDYISKDYSKRYGPALGVTEAKASKIVGNGNHFTAWFIENWSSGQVTGKHATIISGTLTDEGIKDMYYSFTSLEKANDLNHLYVDPGTTRTFKDADGLSMKDEWWEKQKSEPTETHWETIDFGNPGFFSRSLRKIHVKPTNTSVMQDHCRLRSH